MEDTEPVCTSNKELFTKSGMKGWDVILDPYSTYRRILVMCENIRVWCVKPVLGLNSFPEAVWT